MLLSSSTAQWFCLALAIDGVAVQVVEPLNSSADDSVLVPLFPPSTSTVPFATMDVGSTVAVCPKRAVVIVPAADQLPFENPGSKIRAVLRTVEPFLPPVTRIFPFEFGSALAVCCSRGPLIDASVENAFCDGSNRNTDASVAVPLLPPTSRTRLLSCAFDVWISVAVPKRQPAGGIGPIVAAQLPVPDAGL